MLRFYHYYVLILLISSPFAINCFLDITKHGYEQYQDIIINGKIVKKATHNHHHNDERYEIIKRVLDHYQRPFTMLDLGASQGYYSFRSAADFNHAVCVMIEGNNSIYPMIGTQLLDLCKQNTKLSNIILLNKKIELTDIQRLSECEHFDVVLVLNILHWFGSQWKLLADAVMNLGDIIIVETPPIETVCSARDNKIRGEIIRYFIDRKATIIGTVPRHTSDTETKLYSVEGTRRYILRRTWLKKEKEKETHRIYSNFKEKKLIKQPDWPPSCTITSEWLPGINLVTFMMYNGAYPTSSMIKEAVANVRFEQTNDWMPNNMILTGTHIRMIDCDDPNHNPGGRGGGRRYSPSLEQKVCRWLDLTDSREVEQFFWNSIVPIK